MHTRAQPGADLRTRRCRSIPPVAVAFALAIALPSVARAKSHLWRFTEVFSNAEGTIQFIEMYVFDPAGTAEIQFGGRPLTSKSNTFIFPANLPNQNTYNRAVLLATQSFADLPGAPTPDYILPEKFFDPTGDEIRYRSIIDLITIAPGALPTDGVHSLLKDQFGQLSTGTNSPTNFAGDTGSVTLETEPTHPGSAAFQQAVLFAGEDDDAPTSIAVERLGGADGAVTVEVAATGGSAEEGIDYQLDDTLLSWADGDAGTKVVELVVFQDSEVEGPETLHLGLRDPSGGLGLTNPSDLLVTLRDDDQPEQPEEPEEPEPPQEPQDPEPSECVPSATRLCLNGGRFGVEIDWRDVAGKSGQGQAIALTSDSGYFWFYQAANVEVVVKVLNACSFANRYWVFAAGLTNVEVTLRVQDLESQMTKTYKTTLGEPFAPILDGNAFATCP